MPPMSETTDKRRCRPESRTLEQTSLLPSASAWTEPGLGRPKAVFTTTEVRLGQRQHDDTTLVQSSQRWSERGSWYG